MANRQQTSRRVPNPRPARIVRVAGVMLLAAITLSGCGGASPTSPSQSPAASAYQETVTGNVTAYGINQHALTPPRSGQMRVLLTWANGAIDLDLYLTDSTCNSYPPLHCTRLASSEAASGTSETINRQVASGEQVKVWVDSFHLTLASDYTIQVTIQ